MFVLQLEQIFCCCFANICDNRIACAGDSRLVEMLVLFEHDDDSQFSRYHFGYDYSNVFDNVIENHWETIQGKKG
ncbi:hypothetical protein DERF_010872 [Dermatophagoides farinae]|uniref:Uncharacterized protein n=1 Tax=Dermatophagoides farinae TaxID=6954 RepID=A0A922HV45_DERFA|nr:hypothetical protein DERF_010872 [Dermatophagoides farinae]